MLGAFFVPACWFSQPVVLPYEAYSSERHLYDNVFAASRQDYNGRVVGRLGLQSEGVCSKYERPSGVYRGGICRIATHVKTVFFSVFRPSFGGASRCHFIPQLWPHVGALFFILISYYSFVSPKNCREAQLAPIRHIDHRVRNSDGSRSTSRSLEKLIMVNDHPSVTIWTQCAISPFQVKS